MPRRRSRLILCTGIGIAAWIAVASAGTFVQTGDMAQSRVSHTATLLPDGTVLVAGGTSLAFATAERYDLATGTFAATGSMSTGRYGHSATLLANGTVLVAGGFSLVGGATSTAELYSAAAGVFTPTGNLVTPRLFHMSARLADGRVLLAGGQAGGVAFMRNAEIYDPATGTFAATGSMVHPRWGGTATVLNDGRVLVTGGYGNNSQFKMPSGSLPDAEVFDPATGQFTSTGAMSIPRQFHSAVALTNGTVLVAGGENNGAIAGMPGTLASAELFDPALGAFAPTQPLQHRRRLFTATLLANGQVLVAAGVDDDLTGDGDIRTATAELYDPNGGGFQFTGSLTFARSQHSATRLQNGRVLIAGGGGGGNWRAEVYGSALAPTANDGTLAAVEDTNITSTLSATDPDGDPLTYSIVSNGQKGTASIIDASTGAYGYTPNGDEFGADSFTFKVNDGFSDSNIATVTVTIAAVNDAPVAYTPSFITVANSPVNGTLVGTDVDSAVLTYSVVTNGTLGTAVVTNASTGAFTYTPNANATGYDTFTYLVNDGLLDSNLGLATVAIRLGTLTGARFELRHSFSGCAVTGCQDGNDGAYPQGALVTASNGVVYGTTGGATSTNPGSVFAVSPTTGYSSLFGFSTPGSPGCFPIERLAESGGEFYGVAQGCGAFGDGTIFKVNPAGQFTKLHDLTEGIPANNGVDAGGVAFGPDGRLYSITRAWGSNTFGSIYRLEPNGTTTTVHSFNGSDGWLPTGELTTASDGTIYGVTVDGGTPFGCSFGGGSCGTVFKLRPDGTFGLAHSFVNSLNPLAAYPASGVVQGADGNFYGLARQVAYRLTPDDTYTELHQFESVLEGQELEGLLVQASDGYFYGVLGGGASGPDRGGVFRMSPAGAVSIVHRFSGADGSRPLGGMSQGSDGYLYGTTYAGGADDIGTVFRLTLVAAVDAGLAATEDQPATGTLSGSTLANLPLTYSIVTNGTLGTATITDPSTGAFTYSPSANANGNDTFTFKVSDGTTDSNVATVSIAIAPVNDVPVALDTAISTTVPNAVSGTFVATDVENSPLQFAIVSNGTRGTAVLTDASTGAFTYTPASGVTSGGGTITPNAGAFATDTITFTATDGALTSNVGSVTISLIGIGDPSELGDAAIATAEDTPVSGRLPAVGGGARIVYALVSGGTLGAATITDPVSGAFTYVPAADAHGQDRFTVRASIGGVPTNVATVTVDIMPADDAPVAYDAHHEVRRGEPLAASLSATDADGSPLSFAITGRRRLRGELRVEPSTGRFTFSPAAGATGTGWFSFSVTDDTGRTATGRVTISTRR